MGLKDDNISENDEPSCGSREFTLWRPESQYSTRRVIQIYGKNLDELIETANSQSDEKNRPIFTEEQTKEHYWTFHNSMKKMLLWGQCIGLIPVTHLLDGHPWKVRFQKFSFIFFYSAVISMLTITLLNLCLYEIYVHTFNIRTVALLIFFLTTSATALTFIHAASKWPTLIKSIYSSKLAVDSSIVGKCTAIFWVLAGLGLLEHLLSIIASVAKYSDCFRDEGFHGYMQIMYSFVFVSGIPKHYLVAAITMIVIFISAMQWNFANIFMISMSIYLASVLQEVNKKVELAVQQDMPPHHWRALREAYTRATKLVKLFDNVTNPITFVTFSSSLFFICYRLYFVLITETKSNFTSKCPYFPSGPFHGYENIIYFLASLVLVLLRSISFVLFAASVHQTSRTIAQTLYEVSPANYCYEVDRFIEQVHNDTIALSGYDFFFITREIILSVANAIVTYELVLVQFQQGKDVFQILYPPILGSGSVTSTGTNHTQTV